MCSQGSLTTSSIYYAFHVKIKNQIKHTQNHNKIVIHISELICGKYKLIIQFIHKVCTIFSRYDYENEKELYQKKNRTVRLYSSYSLIRLMASVRFILA